MESDSTCIEWVAKSSPKTQQSNNNNNSNNKTIEEEIAFLSLCEFTVFYFHVLNHGFWRRD